MKIVLLSFVLLALAAGPGAAGGRGEAGSGATGAQPGGGQAPVLIETDLTRTAQIAQGSRIRTTGDGLLVIYDSVGDKKEYIYLDLSAARKRSVSTKLAGVGSTFALDAAGNICVLDLKTIPGAGSDAPPKGFQRKYTVLSSEGKQLSTADLGDIAWDQSNPWYATDIAVGEGGQFFLGTPKGIEAYDAKGKLRRLLGSFSCQAVATDGKGGLYGGGYSTPGYQGVLQKVDPGTGKTVWEVKVSDPPTAMSLDQKAGVLTVLDQRAVTRYSLDGKSLGQVLLIRNTTLNGQNIYNYSFGVDAAGGLWFIARDPPANKTDPWSVRFLSFRPGTAAEVAAAAPAHVLSISHAFWYDMTEETAGKMFQRNNPDWKVEIRKTVTQQDMGGEQDVFASTMTELLAGRGADVISLSFLPWHNLVDKGLLVDLDTLIAKDKSFDAKKLRANVLEASRYGGILPGLATGFAQEILYASGMALADAGVTIDDATWSWADFYAAAAKVRKDTNGDGTVDRFAMLKMDAREFYARSVAQGALAAYVDQARRTARFTDPSFAALLEATKAFCESNAKDNPYTWESYIDGVMKGAIVFEFQYIQSPSFSTFARGYFHGDVKVCSLPGQSAVGDLAYAPDMYGINAGSKNTAAAWDYIKVLVSNDFQGSQFIYGLPTNNVAYAQKVEEQRNLPESQRRGTMGDGTRSWDITFPAFTDADLSLMNKLTARIRRVQYNAENPNGIVSRELAKFWTGERSAEDVSRSIQDKVMTWLRE